MAYRFGLSKHPLLMQREGLSHPALRIVDHLRHDGTPLAAGVALGC